MPRIFDSHAIPAIVKMEAEGPQSSGRRKKAGPQNGGCAGIIFENNQNKTEQYDYHACKGG